jgi:hypothetical protein
MKVTKQTLDKINKCYSVFITDDYSNEYNENDPDELKNANRIIIGFEYGSDGKPTGEYIGKTIKTPKSKEVTFDWLMDKINKENVYTNFSKEFKKILDIDSIDIYPTSYGIGIFVLFGKPRETAKKNR